MQIDPTIQNELIALNSMLAGAPNTNVYTVPDGYFEAMTQDILHTIHQVPSIESTGSKDIPEGYFENLADSILNRIKNESALEAEVSSLLASMQSVEPYSVPEGYFEGFATGVMKKINAGEEGSELLEQVKNINPYKVPHSYFDGLAVDIVNQLPQPAKVVIMQKRSFTFRYAAAAVITGILGLSLFSIMDKKQDNSVGTAQIAVIADQNFDQALASISDDEIVAYLKQSGEDVNAALVASASENTNLPEQTDYLTDGNTLDNFLKELNIKDQPATN